MFGKKLKQSQHLEPGVPNFNARAHPPPSIPFNGRTTKVSDSSSKRSTQSEGVGRGDKRTQNAPKDDAGEAGIRPSSIQLDKPLSVDYPEDIEEQDKLTLRQLFKEKPEFLERFVNLQKLLEKK